MVLLHMKRSDQEQFLYETTVESLVRDTVQQLVEVHNLRQKIHKLKLEGEELAKYGPAKQPDQQGIDKYSDTPVERGPHYTEDPTGRRTGNACNPDVAKVLVQTLEEAELTAHKTQVDKKVALNVQMLKDAVDRVRGAVMICYPIGLPDWDFVRVALEDKEDLQPEDLQQDKASLWFAGKELLPDKKLSDYVGRNERTKAVVKLQKKGQGAPSREPVVDAETQKAMISWYHKKQEEQKNLVEDEEDSFVDSRWANTKNLKAHFAGVQAVRLPK